MPTTSIPSPVARMRGAPESPFMTEQSCTSRPLARALRILQSLSAVSTKGRNCENPPIMISLPTAAERYPGDRGLKPSGAGSSVVSTAQSFSSGFPKGLTHGLVRRQIWKCADRHCTRLDNSQEENAMTQAGRARRCADCRCSEPRLRPRWVKQGLPCNPSQRDYRVFQPLTTDNRGCPPGGLRCQARPLPRASELRRQQSTTLASNLRSRICDAAQAGLRQETIRKWGAPRPRHEAPPTALLTWAPWDLWAP
jgi:hypothetical protein